MARQKQGALKIHFRFACELNQKLGFPYFTPNDPSRRYLDLKANPNQTELIPEIKGFPELRPLIETLNRPEARFRSLGCEAALEPLSDQSQQWKLTSYVDVAFDPLMLNFELHRFESLGGDFREWLQQENAQVNNLTGIEFVVGSCCFNELGCRWGYYLALWVHGYGRSVLEARVNWIVALNRLDRFFSQISSSFR